MRTSLSLIPGELWSAKCTTQGEGLLHPRPGKGRVDLPGRGQFYGEEGTVVSNGLEALKERCGSLKWGFGCGAHSTDYGSQRDRSQVIITSWIHPFPATECGDGSQRSLSFRAPLRTSLAPQHLHKRLPWPFSLLQREASRKVSVWPREVELSEVGRWGPAWAPWAHTPVLTWSNSFLMPFLLPPLMQSVAMSCPFHPFHAPHAAGITR